MDISASNDPTCRKVSWMGSHYAITVTRSHSAGIVGVFECTVPAGEGPPLHRHRNEDEVVHVIEGDYEFWLDGKISRAGPGSSVFLPRGVPHSFRVIGSTPGRNLAIATPGGFEAFFIDAAERDLRIPADMPELMELAERYGLEFLGPADWR